VFRGGDTLSEFWYNEALRISSRSGALNTLRPDTRKVILMQFDHTPTSFFPENIDDYAPWVASHGLIAPYGECQCGCGADAPIAKLTNMKYGHSAGEPVRFLPTHTRGPKRSASEKFWQFLEPGDSGSCWLWRGRINDGGYGVLSHSEDGKTQLFAHRLSYIIHFGEIPDGLWVLHKCDNPPCCNPNHLYAGTAQDNMDDVVERSRRTWHGQKGEFHPRAKLTEEQVRFIRSQVFRRGDRTRIAKRFGVSVSLVGMIINRKVWGHVTDE